ncbi:single-stranded-DNA-specific exonuclease RecJ [Methylobrevis albus]|uniref:Single-stranded-DNA-specific exonuclease RecJ n=1 Tax=Methylobrevis albus TaxID=2793297 RepID=A0A931N1D4_9HYPH|nr:single-stranded-DNA-specific exonuclease RecJ [Methylobrevis albus]MBH0239711.1 single-stranded-DNA-specific exonuclease RecJ [Methylobrevis albus]
MTGLGTGAAAGAATPRRFVLDVARSVSDRAWIDRLDPAAAPIARAIAQREGVPEVVARVLAARGVGVDEAAAFLAPSLKALMPDPGTLRDMEAAAERVADAVAAGARVVIFGDYDVDGATSSAIVSRFLAAQGIKAEIVIPDRIVDGYGPNPRLVEEIAARADLMIAVDCGTHSFEAFETARARGLDVVVFDHHQAGETLPSTAALVNPNRQDDLSGLGHLCAAGVAFLGMVAVNRVLRRRGRYAGGGEPDLFALLDLVALGTICDVVPLIGLNRAFVVQGLKVMRARANRGIAALCDVVRLNGPVTPYHLGFLIGPRINAGGRIGDAALGARLLTSDDMLESSRIATELDALNKERQAIEAAMLAEAEATVAVRLVTSDPAVILAASADWHPGIVGLVAARLKERHARPAFAIALDPDGRGTGSGRSVAGVDLGRVVRAAVDEGLLLKGGGHAMAAGLTVAPGGIEALEAFLESRLAADVAEARTGTEFLVDGALTAGGANIALAEMLERAGPFGSGQPEPVFVFPAHRIVYADPAGHGHVRVTLASSDGARIKAMAFRAAERPLGEFLLGARDRPVHVAAVLTVDHWQGEARGQLRLLDAADPATTARGR